MKTIKNLTLYLNKNHTQNKNMSHVVCIEYLSV